MVENMAERKTEWSHSKEENIKKNFTRGEYRWEMIFFYLIHFARYSHRTLKNFKGKKIVEVKN